MESGTIWSIIGIVISVIFGLIGIYLTIRSKYSGRITFVNEQTIELFDAIGNSLDKLAVTYNGSAVNENLVLLNGAFINSGKFDITKDMVEQPITITLPEGYKWLTGRIVDSNVKAEFIQVDDNNVSISTGLFRCGEYIRFHALAQLPETDKDVSNSERFKKAISFEHRIVNTKSIKETETHSQKDSFKTLKKKGIPLFLMLLATSGIFGFVIYEGIPKVLVYSYAVSKSNIEQVQFKSTNNDLVKVISNESEFEIEQPFSDFMERTIGVPTLSDQKDNYIFYIFFPIYIVIILILFLNQAFEYYRNRRLLKILGD